MANEMYLEGHEADMSEDLSALITYMIDDVREFGSKSTSRSLTIVMPGTKKNNALFGNIFDFNTANRYSGGLANVGYNFNPAVNANVIIFQNRIQVFKGVLRLIEIVIDRGSIEYEVSVIGELGGFVYSMGNKKLEDLDFSQYDTTFNGLNIINSWETEGAGVFFPLIDYGNTSTGAAGAAKHDWQISTFRPALYVKEYIDKIFAASGYKYQCDLFNTSRFKRLIVPYNKKSLNKKGSNIVTAAGGPLAGSSVQFDPASNDQHSYSLFYTGQTLTSFEPYSDGFNVVGFKYTGATDMFIDIRLNGTGQLETNSGITFQLTSFGDGLPTIERTAGDMGATAGSIPVSYAVAFPTIQVKTGMIITIKILELNSTNAYYTSLSNFNYSLIVAGEGVTFVDINIGDPLPINDAIPSNVLQKDFVIDIIKLFNLYVIEDKYKPKKLLITPYPNFYSNQVIDWSKKLDWNKPVKIKPLSELGSRYYNFKFKSDSDFYNDEYKKRYNLGYGDYVFDTEFQMSNESASIELNFAGTPLVGYPGEDKIYSTIFKLSNGQEESVDSVIRILFSKKITGVTPWKMMSGGVALGTIDGYGYAGHLDDPDAPGSDINFGVPKQLYFNLISGSLQVNQFNVYYSPYLAEITDKDSKMLTASFNLNPQDIEQVDFSKLIYIDGVKFRLNKIEDYNATKDDTCFVELLTVIKTKY